MSHTPGPWTYDEESNEVYRLDSAGHVEACLCEIRGEPNWRDNARLIAAAPDLLKALQKLVKAMGYHVPIHEYHRALDAAREAIRKATAPRININQDDWVEERSSGYLGWRNTKTGAWMYDADFRKAID